MFFAVLSEFPKFILILNAQYNNRSRTHYLFCAGALDAAAFHRIYGVFFRTSLYGEAWSTSSLSAMPLFCCSATIDVACSKQMFCIGETDIAQNMITITVLRLRAKIFVIRFLDGLFLRNASFLFTSYLKAQTICCSILVFSSKSRNYSPQAFAEAVPFTLFMLLDQFVTLREAAATSFLRSSYGHP